MRKSLSLLLASAALSVGSPVAVSAEYKVDKPLVAMPAAAAREKQQVADAVRALGFTVGAVVPAGKGAWDVQVEQFDPARAVGAMRGVVRGAQTRFAIRGQQAVAARGGLVGGRPGVGGTRAIDGGEDGSQTGSGGGQQPDDPFGIGGGDGGGGNEGGGGDQGGSGEGGARAGDGPSDPARGSDPVDPGVDSSGSPRSSTLRVSVEAGGALRVDAQSLRALGLSVGRQQAGNLQVR